MSRRILAHCTANISAAFMGANSVLSCTSLLCYHLSRISHYPIRSTGIVHLIPLLDCGIPFAPSLSSAGAGFFYKTAPLAMGKSESSRRELEGLCAYVCCDAYVSSAFQSSSRSDCICIHSERRDSHDELMELASIAVVEPPSRSSRSPSRS